jgi:hypothetical protein
MTAEELHDLVIAQFGERGDKSNTSALCTLGKFPKVIIGAVQGSAFTKTPEGFDDVRDAREVVDTKRKKSEWTGYHAEMIILSALIGYSEIDSTQTLAAIKLTLENKCGTIVIGADAPCCKHCGNMLDALGIKYHGDKGAAGLTGWWNPISDIVAANGSLEFAKDIPS